MVWYRQAEAGQILDAHAKIQQAAARLSAGG